MWTIQPEHSTENWNVICSLKSLCTQQIVGLDVFSTSVMWVSLVDSVQQSLIHVCPFLHHSWRKMNLCACFSCYQSLMKLLVLCCGGLGQLPWSEASEGQVWHARVCLKEATAHSCWAWRALPHSWAQLDFCNSPSEETLGFLVMFRAQGAAVPCSCVGAGWETCGAAGRGQTAFSSHREGKNLPACPGRRLNM